jgi:hypothetical protein
MGGKQAMRKRRLTAGTSLLLGALMGLAGPPQAQTTVYRCTEPDGSVELRQRPCNTGATEEALTVEDRRTGWVPPAAGSAGPDASGKEEPARQGARRASKTDARQAERCWEKRRQLEEVDAELRHGYKPARGERLRQRRSAYEEYIGRFCRGK